MFGWAKKFISLSDNKVNISVPKTPEFTFVKNKSGVFKTKRSDENIFTSIKDVISNFINKKPKETKLDKTDKPHYKISLSEQWDKIKGITLKPKHMVIGACAMFSVACSNDLENNKHTDNFEPTEQITNLINKASEPKIVKLQELDLAKLQAMTKQKAEEKQKAQNKINIVKLFIAINKDKTTSDEVNNNIKMASDGHKWAEREVGLALINKNPEYLKNIDYDKKDITKAGTDLLKMSADQGDKKANIDYAYMQYHGINDIKQNRTAAKDTIIKYDKSWTNGEKVLKQAKFERQEIANNKAQPIKVVTAEPKTKTLKPVNNNVSSEEITVTESQNYAASATTKCADITQDTWETLAQIKDHPETRKSVKHTIQMAEKGQKWALRDVGLALINNNPTYTDNINGDCQNSKEIGTSLLKQAADKGDKKANIDYAYMQYHGINGVKEERTVAENTIIKYNTSWSKGEEILTQAKLDRKYAAMREAGFDKPEDCVYGNSGVVNCDIEVGKIKQLLADAGIKPENCEISPIIDGNSNISRYRANCPSVSI